MALRLKTTARLPGPSVAGPSMMDLLHLAGLIPVEDAGTAHGAEPVHQSGP
jgi:hypothetical protein